MTNDNQNEAGIEAKVSRGFIDRAAKLAAPENVSKSFKLLEPIILRTALAATIANGEFDIHIKVKAKDGVVQGILGQNTEAVKFLATLTEEEIIAGISKTLAKPVTVQSLRGANIFEHTETVVR